MTRTCQGSACFETLEGERSRVVGELHFDTVGGLLAAGEAAIGAGQAAVIDLKDVTESDSAGLALLIEWISYARSANKALRYENVPSQIHELADLSDVEELLKAS